jgi:hypothetical protein
MYKRLVQRQLQSADLATPDPELELETQPEAIGAESTDSIPDDSSAANSTEMSGAKE